MTRAEYTERARPLCRAVNARRLRVGKEPLREQHIMRVVRLALGPAPAAVYPDKYSPVQRNAPIPYVLTELALRHFARRADSG